MIKQNHITVVSVCRDRNFTYLALFRTVLCLWCQLISVSGVAVVGGHEEAPGGGPGGVCQLLHHLKISLLVKNCYSPHSSLSVSKMILCGILVFDFDGSNLQVGVDKSSMDLTNNPGGYS